ncbi:Rap1a/Tai family immunity protein [Indioceanicola profundi]|uniref:Rap1a/Tai family immunity protein n=1 Tax=Indioceanicola profundi TaxID=2220096 RepID=UPI000E6AA7FF|nr:Rap1a/Tai family immunity protein [Indioceanicola profundi]
MLHRSAALLPAVLLATTAAVSPARAADTDTARVWYENCSVFIDVMRGTGEGSDAEISYCVGQTEGIVSALRTGSQIGALAFAGLLTVEAGMNEQAVFALFKQTEPDKLIGICMPEDIQTSTQIETVHSYIEAHPDKQALPVTALFFEALQQRYACAHLKKK